MKEDESWFTSKQGLEGVLSAEDEASRRMSSSGDIAPANIRNRDLFEQITINAHNLDKLIIQALQPNTDNKSALSPTYYQQLLSESVQIFRSQGQATDNPVYNYCANLVDNEINLLEIINMQRNQMTR